MRVTAAPLGIKSSLNQPAAGPRKDIFLCSAKEAKGIKKSHRDPRSLNCKVVGAVPAFVQAQGHGCNVHGQSILDTTGNAADMKLLPSVGIHLHHLFLTSGRVSGYASFQNVLH